MSYLKLRQIQIFLLVLSISASSCIPRLKLNKIKHDEKAGFYVYEKNNNRFALRTEDGRLVFQDSLRVFLTEMANNDMVYIVEQKSENAVFFKSNEQALVINYNALNQCVTDGNFADGQELAKQFLRKYPAAFKFTDIDFLQGQLWEKYGNLDSAANYYKHFLQFSEQKYSGYFRGYAGDTASRNCYLNERQYAKTFLSNKQTTISADYNKIIAPKYYYQSFSQGFVLNREDFGQLKKNIYGLALLYNSETGTQFGLGCTWLMNEKYIVAASFISFKNKVDFTLSSSFQLYKSSGNAFGLKLSPILVFSKLANPDSTNASGNLFNPGLAISVGYRFSQRLHVGASYTAYLYNQYTYSDFKKSYFIDNEYDVSLYYQLMRGVSVKTGIYCGYPVVGFGLTGSFLGYFFKNKSMGISLNNY